MACQTIVGESQNAVGYHVPLTPTHGGAKAPLGLAAEPTETAPRQLKKGIKLGHPPGGDTDTLALATFALQQHCN